MVTVGSCHGAPPAGGRSAGGLAGPASGRGTGRQAAGAPLGSVAAYRGAERTSRTRHAGSWRSLIDFVDGHGGELPRRERRGFEPASRRRRRRAEATRRRSRQHLHILVADRAQHPPHPRRRVRAVRVVVHDHARLRRDAPLRDLPQPAIDGRQRMASALRRIAGSAELRLEVGVNRAFEMAGRVGLARTSIEDHHVHA